MKTLARPAPSRPVGGSDPPGPLVGRIYETISDPGLWTEILGAVALLLAANAVWLIRPEDDGRSLFVGSDASARLQDVQSADCAGRMLRAVLSGTDEPQPSVLSVFRPPGAPPFSPVEEALFAATVGHMARAIELDAKATRPPLHQALVERMPQAAMLLGAHGLVVQANEAARALFSNGDILRLRQGRLAAMGRADATRLATLLAGGRSGDMLLEACGDGHLVLTVTPLPPATVLATVIDPRRLQAGLPALLCRLFGLSAAEARVASALTEGLTPTEIGAAHRVSVATVRSQIVAIYAKLRVHRQAELVRLLTRLGDHQFG